MSRLKPYIAVLLVIYTVVMLWLLFGQRIDITDYTDSYTDQLKYNPYPFETVFRFGNIILTGEPAYLVPHAWQNLAGNVVMFVPIGFCLPLFSKRCRTLRRTFLWGLLIIAGVELTQFFSLLGSLDFDDFMLNSLGVLLGFWIWRFLCGKFGD